MTRKLLFFDYRESEKEFFKTHDFSTYDIKFFEESLNEETFKKLSQDDIENAMVISVFITSRVDDNIISKFKNLRAISTRSTGYDHISLNSCVNKNVALLNVEGYGNNAVSQFTFMLILMLVRKIYPVIQTGVNNKLPGHNLNGMTLGIVGTGAIGSGVCHAASCFGMKILAYDAVKNTDLENDYGVEYTTLDVLLKNSDIVTLHIPYNEENYHMFSAEQFRLMKDNSYFINVARGELVDTEALSEFAKQGKFAGIALDVVACADEKSPKTKDISSVECPQTSVAVKELLNLPNVIITPHIAYDTQEAVDYILEATFKGLADCLTGGKKYRII